ncbi:unnamed protein product [Rotaria sp. Silwood2]|nr:unnamed protein product [Rotaria sp. Silwood2]CAF4372585.1 unnamed protein product [Rotaria sp. Silwood2]CAF4439803.1 unnamed protein product [Rotaria sp. Silwood2]CAF4451498.1 unnamed protein product [Rotaria sp. Silwood2]
MLIEEVIRTIRVRESEHGRIIRERKKRLTILQKEQEALNTEEERRSKLYQEASETANRAEVNYDKALKEIPTGWEALAKEFLRELSKVAHTVAKSATSLLTFGKGNSMMPGIAPLLMSSMTSGYPAMPMNAMEKRSIDESPTENADDRSSFAYQHTIDMAGRFSNSLAQFEQVAESSGGNVTAMDSLAVVFKLFREHISGLGENAAKNNVLQLIQRSGNILKRAMENSKEQQPNYQVEEEVLEEIRDISKRMRPYQTTSQLSDPIDSINTQRRTQEDLDASSKRNEVLKARIAQKHLAEMRKRQDKYADDLTKTLEEIRETNSKILQLDITNIDYGKIIEILEEAGDLRSKLQQKWHKFVIFFSTLSEQIKNLIRHSLQSFLDSASIEEIMKRHHRLKLINQLKDGTFSIHSESYKYFVLSRTYYEVSS